MNSERIVITRPLPGDAVGMLGDAGFEQVWINPEDAALPREALLKTVKGASAIITYPGDRDLNAEVFDAAGEQLKIVSAYAVGVDNIDVAEATRRGILIGHTPDPVTEPTADIAWLLLLGAARRAHEGATLVRSGGWTGVGPRELLGHKVRGKTLLIIGAGRIGTAVAWRSLGWRMNLIYRTRTVNQVIERPPLRAKQIGLEKGLQQADFVSIHTPYTEHTHHLINADRLKLMKPTAVLVNTARGKCIDEAALVEALKDGTIAAAGLDVYENEPKLHPELAALPNTFLLPHLGSATIEDRRWMVKIAVHNTIAALRGDPLPHEFRV